MKLGDLAGTLELECLTPDVAFGSREITGGYASDLLSDVLAHGPTGGVLVTVQVHLNVVAVSLHAELAAVIFAMDRRPEADVIAKAVEEGLALFTSPQSAFDLAGRLYTLGVRGPQM